MSDLIRRSDAIEACAYETFECYEARKAIRNLPSADRPQEWIPCSERLPEGDVQVLVNVVAHDRVYDIVLCPADFVEEYYANGKVNAWMPLPLAWEGADDVG